MHSYCQYYVACALDVLSIALVGRYYYVFLFLVWLLKGDGGAVFHNPLSVNQ